MAAACWTKLAEMTRLSMYVDGWNFYYSLKGAGIQEYGWCNFSMLAKQQTSEKDAEVKVKYFTSVDKPNKEKIDRQTSIWWTALDFMKCDIIKGSFAIQARRSRIIIGLSARSGAKSKRTWLWHLTWSRIAAKSIAASNLGHFFGRLALTAPFCSQGTRILFLQ